MAELPFQTKRINPDERECLEIAVLSVETVYDARLVAMVLIDKRGTFVTMRGGVEHHVVRLLETIDWAHARMIADEHIR